MKQHYLDLKDMPFYAGLCKYMSSGPVFAMVRLTPKLHNIKNIQPKELYQNLIKKCYIKVFK